MKNLLIALLLLTGICFSPAQSCYTLPSGLVSWWRGDGNAQDSAQCNNGTLVNGAHYATGLFGQCFEFDGVNDYVEIPHSSNLSFHTNSTMTIEFWVYSTDPRLPVHMLGKRSEKRSRITGWDVIDIKSGLIGPACCDVVPVLYTGAFCTGDINETLYCLETLGSSAAPGFRDPEGIVIFHVAAQCCFKRTIKDDEAPKTLPELKDPAQLSAGVEAAQAAFTEKCEI